MLKFALQRGKGMQIQPNGLKEMPEDHVVELCGKKVWNEWLKENRPGKIFKFKKKEDKNDKNSK